MKFFKIENTKAVKTSKHDETIDEFLESFENEGNNVLPFEDEGQCAAVAQRMSKAYTETLKKLGVKARVLKVRKNAHPEIFEAGFKVMIVLAQEDERDEDDEEQTEKKESKNPFGI